MKMSVSSALLSGLLITPSIAFSALLGLTPGLPTIDFGGSSDISFNAKSGKIRINASPNTFFSVSPFKFASVQDIDGNNRKHLDIQFLVNSQGQVIPGNSSVPDLILTGAIDMNGDGLIDYSGTLLTAQIWQYGFLNGSTGHHDVFDLRMNAIGGSLAGFYTESDLAVKVISENSVGYSAPFNGRFNTNWQGQAKGVIGSAMLTQPQPLPAPLPAAFWLWSGALTLLLPVFRKKKWVSQP